MQIIDDYLDQARERQGFTSDRQLSKALDITPSSLNAWRLRKSWPADLQMIRLAEMAGSDANQALIDLNIWRAKSPVVVERYQALAKALVNVAIVLGLGAALFTFPSETKAAQITSASRDGYILWEILSILDPVSSNGPGLCRIAP